MGRHTSRRTVFKIDEYRACLENLDELNHRFALRLSGYPPLLQDDKLTRDQVADEVLRDFLLGAPRDKHTDIGGCFFWGIFMMVLLLFALISVL